MAIDDHPVTALRKRLEIENASSTPFVDVFVKVLSSVIATLPAVPSAWTLFLDGLKSYIDADSGHRIKTMLDTCADEIVRLSAHVDKLSEGIKDLKGVPMPLSLEEYESRAQLAAGLVLDAARKASATRDEKRVKRIGTILAHGLQPKSTDEADEIEEMMRIAMELSDRDVLYLRDLVQLEGDFVRSQGRIARYEAHQRWESSVLGGKRDPEVESVFSKLTSYGLVWRLPPQNNMNVMADIQNGYALLPKGLRFADFIASERQSSAQ